MSDPHVRLSSPAPPHRRALSPGHEAVVHGPLELNTKMSHIQPEKVPVTPAAEAPLNLEEYIDPHLFKQLPPLFSTTPHVTDLQAYTTHSLLARPTLFSIAQLSQRLLTASNPTDYQRILHLWILRLASLSLLSLPLIAEAEAQALSDFNTSDIFRTKTGHSVIPWTLRVLLVKIQTQAHGQLGIAKYYSLAREARIESWKSAKRSPDDQSDPSDLTTQRWETRLLKCGLYIAAMLSHIKDFAAAFEHVSAMLDSCPADDGHVGAKVKIMQVMALLCVEAGDETRAVLWFDKLPNHTADPIPETPTVLLEQAAASLSVTEPPNEDKVERDTLFTPTEPPPATVVTGGTTHFNTDKGGDANAAALASDNAGKCNVAIAYLYDGRVDMARVLFKELIATGFRFTDLIFSFCLLDELKHEIQRISEYL
ncbi:hypothetical protein POJ06DRAFT_256142 [Lipomyces tetrasporus]|uniref:Uncharacterized protein n=1 Tax=Lipomyces tetrasporus TaxID=54092 RepID=A0AAD7QPX6_9ASCO|nr:uncharacterized protein POJ06DRAFT_256142 [Lipomyces tetrasporus]KAJ8099153.1 hypothetical protein POJ06DRAFT_256142 [Lipomyces tetrasporus]